MTDRISEERLRQIEAERPFLVIQDDEYQRLAMDLRDCRSRLEQATDDLATLERDNAKLRAIELDLQSRLAAMTQERDEYRRHFLAVRVQRNTFEAQSIRLALNLCTQCGKGVRDSADTMALGACMSCTARMISRCRGLTANVKKLRDALTGILSILSVQEAEESAMTGRTMRARVCGLSLGTLSNDKLDDARRALAETAGEPQGGGR